MMYQCCTFTIVLYLLSNIAIYAAICDVFRNIECRTAVTASLGFYFEREMHVELSWQRASTFGMLLRNNLAS